MGHGERRFVLMTTWVRTFHLDKFCAKIAFILYTRGPFVTQVVSRMDSICSSTVAFEDGPRRFRWAVSRMYAMAVTGIIVIGIFNFVFRKIVIFTYQILYSVTVRSPYKRPNFVCIDTFSYAKFTTVVAISPGGPVVACTEVVVLTVMKHLYVGPYYVKEI